MKEQNVIDAQIKRAHKLFEGFGSAFDRPKEIANGILTLANICDVLIRIVENQQWQIEMLQKALKGTDEVVKGLVADPDAVWALFEEVRRNESGLCPHGAKRVDCVHCDRMADMAYDARREAEQ